MISPAFSLQIEDATAPEHHTGTTRREIRHPPFAVTRRAAIAPPHTARQNRRKQA
jgi:hypothetical protein